MPEIKLTRGRTRKTLGLMTDDVAEAVVTARALWQDQRSPPSWAESDDPLIQAAVARALGCADGRPRRRKKNR